MIRMYKIASRAKCVCYLSVAGKLFAIIECGGIKVDEASIGSPDTNGKPGRGSEKQAIIVVALEVNSPKGFGCVRMRRIPNVSDYSLVPFICDVAEKGSEILTDGWATTTNCQSTATNMKEMLFRTLAIRPISARPMFIAVPPWLNAGC